MRSELNYTLCFLATMSCNTCCNKGKEISNNEYHNIIDASKGPTESDNSTIVIDRPIDEMNTKEFCREPYEKDMIELKCYDPNVKEIPSYINVNIVEYLDIRGSGIENLNVFKSNSVLKGVNISETKISDLSVLANAKQLEELTVANTSVSDIAVLTQFDGLKRLDICNTGIIDIKPLEDMTQLETLDICGQGLKNTDAISKLVNLRELDIENINVEDFNEIIKGMDLEYLVIDNIKLDNLSLKSNNSLEYLLLRDTDIRTLKGIQCPKLQEMVVDNSGVTEIKELKKCKHLEILQISSSPIESIEALVNMKKLKELYLYDTCVGDIDALIDIASLELLDITGDTISLTQINDIKEKRPLLDVYYDGAPNSIECY